MITMTSMCCYIQANYFDQATHSPYGLETRTGSLIIMSKKLSTTESNKDKKPTSHTHVHTCYKTLRCNRHLKLNQ